MNWVIGPAWVLSVAAVLRPVCVPVSIVAITRFLLLCEERHCRIFGEISVAVQTALIMLEEQARLVTRNRTLLNAAFGSLAHALEQIRAVILHILKHFLHVVAF